MNRAEMLDTLESTFREAGFQLSRRCCSRPSCFDLAARKQNLLTFVKVHINIGSVSSKDASELKNISQCFAATPLLVGEKNHGHPLEDDTVYSRYEVYALTAGTLKAAALKGVHPLIEAGPGGYYVRLDGETIRERRQKLGLSAGELAGMIGISKRTLYSYERGMAKASVSIAYKLEWVLGAPIAKSVDVFKSLSSRRKFPSTPEQTPKGNGFLREVFKKLSRFNFFATYVRKAPFDFIARSPRDDFNILGGVTRKNEQNVDQRAKEIVSVSEVVNATPIIITDGREKFDGDIPSIKHDELKRIRKPEDLVASF